MTTDFLSQVSLRTEAPKLKNDGNYKKTRQAVQDFEAFFITQTFQQMYDTIPVNETFGGGQAEKIFRSMLVDEYGKMTAQSGGIGLTDQIMAQLIQEQQI